MKVTKDLWNWLLKGYSTTAKSVDVIRQPALIPFYVMSNFLGTTVYIYMGSQTPLWFCFFFSCIMLLLEIFTLYLYKCTESTISRAFLSFAFSNGLIIWAYYVVCFLHTQESGWAGKHAMQVPIFQVIGGLVCYLHYLYIYKVELKEKSNEQ